MSIYSESTIYKKAKRIGYSIQKGKVHYMHTSYPVFSDYVGYNVIDNHINCMVWGCYNEVFDHLWSLDDVENFLRDKYRNLGLQF